jgi:hypothetical protein
MSILFFTNFIDLVIITDMNETVFGVWNTTAGGDSTPATVGSSVGNFMPGQTPKQAFDRDCSTKYVSFGAYSINIYNKNSGINTGLYLTPQRGPSLLTAIQFCTADDNEERDPLIMTIEGSNHNTSALTLGSSWTLIYNGTTGLEGVTNRLTYGPMVLLPYNSIWYASYRLLITSKRAVLDGVQYSEIELFLS